MVYLCVCVCIVRCMYRSFPPRGRAYTQAHAQASACTCAHARAHRRCRRAQPAAPHRSPAERVRHSARRRAGSGAYPVQRGDRRGVPRADVRDESRRRVERLRAEAARGRRRRARARTIQVFSIKAEPAARAANACTRRRSITIARWCTHS